MVQIVERDLDRYVWFEMRAIVVSKPHFLGGAASFSLVSVSVCNILVDVFFVLFGYLLAVGFVSAV